MPDDAPPSPSFDMTAVVKDRKPSLEAGAEIGRCRVVGYVGRGGMGEVYEVEHLTLGKRFAVKIILPELSQERGFVERFEREAKVTAGLEHPNVIRADDFGEDGGLYWLRMELASGVDVRKWGHLAGVDGRTTGTGRGDGTPQLPVPGPQGVPTGARKVSPESRVRSLSELARAAGGRLPEGLVADLARGFLDGLAFAHARGVVHRDMKPANVLLAVNARGQVVPKVSDFGLARVVGEGILASRAELSFKTSMEQGLSEAGTRAGATTSAVSLVGTYEYMSPEQRRGREAGPQSDVYASGLVIYRLLTGRHSPGFKRPSAVAPGIDRAWDAFLEKALEEEPAERFADAGEMLNALPAGALPVRSGDTLQAEPHKVARGSHPPGGGHSTAETRKVSPESPAAGALAARTEARKLHSRALDGKWSWHLSEDALGDLIVEGQTEFDLGEEAYAEDDARRALRHFTRAKGLYESAFARTEAADSCGREASEMERTEEEASEVDADTFAPLDFDAASRAAEEAARARKAGEFERAAKLYGEAASAFELARDTARADAELRSEVVAFSEKAAAWGFRHEPALRSMMEEADSAAEKMEAAISRRDCAEVVRSAAEAKRLYEDAFAREEALTEADGLRRRAEDLTAECVALEADKHSPGELDAARALLAEASLRRNDGEFRQASSLLGEAVEELGRCREKSAAVRARRVSGFVLKLVAAAIIVIAFLVGMAWLLRSKRTDAQRSAPVRMVPRQRQQGKW